MKKIYLIILCFLLCACGNKQQTINKEISIDQKVEDMLSSMSIEEKIGQMLIITYRTPTVDEKLSKIFEDIKPGGFILFGGNVTTFENTKKFIFDIKQKSKIPLIVTLDQEGGSIQKIQMINDKDILSIPSMEDVGKTENEKLAYDIGTVLAQELKTLGVNVCMAPVVDINNNPNNIIIGSRSFGNNKEIVSKMAISVARGMEDTGIIPTFKHFPGHGDTETDSHSDLPVINKSYEEVYENELQPFISAINSGAKIIMVGHLAFPEITGDYTPSSLSDKVINDILIEKLNYQGLVITDALDMGALINNYSDEEITIKAINAGVDFLLMPRNIYKTVETIKSNISEERINQSVRKILKFKLENLKDYALLDESYLNNESQKAIVQKVLEYSDK